ncbi:hypothetical protein [Streptomyces collinus]|uniref:hypothetical protein n=1 Tax=Streptomyces collinus TaxID=42684 RepID=UPI0036C68B9C
MSEEPTPAPDDFRAWLSERGADAYALAWGVKGQAPSAWTLPRHPRWGRPGSPARART